MRRIMILAGFLMVAAAGCGGTSSIPISANSPPPGQPRFNPAAHGFRQAGGLWTKCVLTFTDGMAFGATLTFYNPSKTVPVQISGIGVEMIDNGVLAGQVPIQTTPFAVPPQIEQAEPVTFDGGWAATSCEAGYQ